MLALTGIWLFIIFLASIGIGAITLGIYCLFRECD